MRTYADPILTRTDVPGRDVSSVFNPGVARFGGRIAMLARVQTRGRETLLWPAFSDDGVQFDLADGPAVIRGLEDVGETVHHAYDPRLTVLEGTCYVVFAVDIDGACRLAIARTEDFEHFDLVAFDAAGDRRNGVLFPRRIGGRYLRLERPNEEVLEGGVRSGGAVVLAASVDLVRWEVVGGVMEGRLHAWDELVGSGPPPVRTAEGWLHLYHGIATHFAAASIYQAGAVLLDASDPTRVLARTRENVLEPRALWEMVGQVPNVVFPSGWTVDGVTSDEEAAPDARVCIYYGAADTCIGLAETTVGELLRACRES